MIGIDFINWQKKDADNFSCIMFRLISKADGTNKLKLRQVYPAHVALYEWWVDSPSLPSADEIIKRGRELETSYAVV